MNVAALLGILASAAVVAAAIATLVRSIWKAAQDVRDNKNATQANTRALDNLKDIMETRIGTMETRTATLEERLWRVEAYLQRGVRR